MPPLLKRIRGTPERREPRHDPLQARQHHALVVGGGEDARPGVEDLHGIGAGLDLHRQVAGHLLGEQVQQARPSRSPRA